MITTPNSAINAHACELFLQELPADCRVDGQSRTGATPVTEFAGLSCGIWEITPGVSRDVETRELFIVLSGRALVTFDDGSPPMQLGPGSIAQLAEGARTIWNVSETLRKVYLIERV